MEAVLEAERDAGVLGVAGEFGQGARGLLEPRAGMLGTEAVAVLAQHLDALAGARARVVEAAQLALGVEHRAADGAEVDDDERHARLAREVDAALRVLDGGAVLVDLRRCEVEGAVGAAGVVARERRGGVDGRDRDVGVGHQPLELGGGREMADLDGVVAERERLVDEAVHVIDEARLLRPHGREGESHG